MGTSRVLAIASQYVTPLLVVLSLVVLYRGHNLPGGGFIGGLIAASGLLLVALARGWEYLLGRLPLSPLAFIVAGLLVAVLSGVPGWLGEGNFLAGEWLPAWQVPVLGKVKLGTPLLFDVGVYLAVIGFTIQSAQAMGAEEERPWKE